jgi:sulfate/thiosulfate transport system permease protein
MQRAEQMGLMGLTALPERIVLPALSRTWTLAGRTALIGAVLSYLAVVLVGPMFALVIETGKVGFGAALTAATSPVALDALGMSLVLVVIALAVNSVVGTLGAIALVRHRFIGRGVVNTLCDLPLAVSPVMIGLAFLLLVGRDGVLAPVLNALGLKVVFSFPGLVIATLFVTLPYTVREIAYVLEEIGTSEEEAATTLGASPWQTFWRVTLPNIRVALGYGLLMTTARTLGEFGAVLVLGGSISGQTQTATTFIHDAIAERQLDGAYGMAIVLAVMSVALLLLLEWAKARRHMATGKTAT